MIKITHKRQWSVSVFFQSSLQKIYCFRTFFVTSNNFLGFWVASRNLPYGAFFAFKHKWLSGQTTRCLHGQPSLASLPGQYNEYQEFLANWLSKVISRSTNSRSFFSRSDSWKVCNLERLYHHMGQGIQAWTSKMCGRQPLKKLKWYGLDRPYYFKFLRLSSTNYIWFILEYLVPYLVFHPNLMSWSCFPLDTLKMTID